MAKRFFLILFIFFVCASGMYSFLKPNLKTRTQEALAHLQHGNFSSAETSLNALSKKNAAVPVTLYQGFLAQARRQFPKADLLFETAHKKVMKKHHDDFLVEILLAKGVNAYFQGNDYEFSLLLEAGKKTMPDYPLIFFFEGLESYLKAHYAEAIQAWTTFSTTPQEKRGGWFFVVTNLLFPTTWQQLHFAHCLIEQDEIQKGRSILEKQSHLLSSHDQELHNLATLFLGMSYLKEAAKMPFSMRDDNYKLASFYFERSGCQDSFVREQSYAITYLQQEAIDLLVNATSEEQRQWGFNFVYTLQEWRAEKALEVLTDQLALSLLEQTSTESMSLCQVIRQKFHGSCFHTLLTEKLLTHISQKLKEEEVENLLDHWMKIESLSISTKLDAEKLAALTSQEIINTVKSDRKKLDSIHHYINFWRKLNPSLYEQKQLANNLLFHSKLIWQKEGYEKKGEQLMKIALSLCVEQTSFQKEIENFLVDLYAQAENSNLIERLTLIYEAMESFQIAKHELVYPSRLANYLADAKYLYQARNYPSAKTHAAWVLKLDPTNQHALSLAGLASFHLGEYGQAHLFLKQLSNLDKYERKALMISKVFSSQEPTKHLAQIDNTDSFDEE